MGGHSFLCLCIFKMCCNTSSFGLFEHVELRRGLELDLLSCHYGIFGDSDDACSTVMLAILFWEMHGAAFFSVNPMSLVMIYNEQTFVFVI